MSILLSNRGEAVLTVADVEHLLTTAPAPDVARHIVELEVQIGDTDPEDPSAVEQAYSDWLAIVTQIANGTYL